MPHIQPKAMETGGRHGQTGGRLQLIGINDSEQEKEMIDVHITVDPVALQLLLATASQVLAASAVLLHRRRTRRRSAPAKKCISASSR